MIIISLDRSTYHFYAHEDPATWQHPTLAVAIMIAMVFGEAATAIMIFDDKTPRLWQRSFAATLLFVPCALFALIAGGHAPGFFWVHTLWLWVITIAMAAAFVGSALYELVKLLKGRRAQ